jgi:hypothetical protein
MVRGNPDLSGYGAGNYEFLILATGISLLVGSFGGIDWFFRGRTIRFFR